MTKIPALNSLKAISTVLISAWLGAALFFSAVVAPASFAVLRAHGLTNASEVAGGIVNRSLGVINVSGFLISGLVLILMLIFRGSYGRKTFLAQALALAIVASMTFIGHWLIAARLRALRTALDLPIDQIAVTDPRRIAFGNLHRYSVLALAVAMVAALIVSYLLARPAQTH